MPYEDVTNTYVYIYIYVYVYIQQVMCVNYYKIVQNKNA